jgi:hypothetical protein
LLGGADNTEGVYFTQRSTAVRVLRVLRVKKARNEVFEVSN